MRILISLLLTAAFVAADEQKFVPAPEHEVNPAVPKGTVTKVEKWESKTFPGTVRDLHLYVPAQYSKDKPAALMVFQDGHDYVNLKGNWRVPTVFDNLIAAGQMPVTIAVFINPGHDKNKPAPQSPWRVTNRSFEYDTLSDEYSTMLVEEIIPWIKKDYALSDDPAMRAIGGASSGGICSFTVAWERPDQFGKVFSTIGSFVNLRGGHVYPALIRITERKPIRIFLQDSSGDLDNPFGNWPLANQNMNAALSFMKYDLKFDYTEGYGHNSNRSGSIFPEAMKWLWRK